MKEKTKDAVKNIGKECGKKGALAVLNVIAGVALNAIFGKK